MLKAENTDVKEFLINQAKDAEEKLIDQFLSKVIPDYDNSSKKNRNNLIQAFELVEAAPNVPLIHEGEKSGKAFLIMEG